MLDFGDVLIGAGRGEEGVVVLEPFWFLENQDGAACLAIFQAASMAWSYWRR